MKNSAFINKSFVNKLFGIILVSFVVYSTGILNVLGGFWRTTYPNTHDTSVSGWGYGYGYGTLGWGYGYGYGYLEVSVASGAADAGYYYSTPSNDSADYDNPTELSDPSTELASVSTIQGTATSATKVTITTSAKFVASGSSTVQVILPQGLEIETSDSSAFNATSLAAETLSAVSGLASSLTTKGMMSFGVSGKTLKFSRPVKISFPVTGVSTSTISINVQHYGGSWGVSGLTNSASATCSGGVASPASSVATVTGGIATIYTCAASNFAAVVASSTSSSASSGGGGGGGSLSLATYGLNTEKSATSVVEQTNQKIEKATEQFTSEKYQKAVPVINAMVSREISKAGLIASLVANDDIVDELSTSYVSFLNGLADLEAGKVSKSSVKAKLARFIKAYDVYQTALKSVATISKATINGSEIEIITPKFANAKVVKAVAAISAQLQKVMEKKGLKGDDLQAVYDLYNNFLLSVKLMKEVDENEGKISAKKILKELVGKLS